MEIWEQLQGELEHTNFELRPCGRSNLVREPRPKVGGGKNHRLSQAVHKLSLSQGLPPHSSAF